MPLFLYQSALAILFLIIVGGSIVGRASAVPRGDDPALIPWPREVTLKPVAPMALTPQSRIVATDATLVPLSKLLSAEIERVSGLRLSVATADATAGDIELSIDATINNHDYVLDVTNRAAVRGANSYSVSLGTVTLLQALQITRDKVTLPALRVTDGPHFEYLGMMLDIARKPYSIDTLKTCVDAARFYKIRHIHLHMSDENAWTFPSTKYPQLGTQNYAWAGGDKPTVYDISELKALVEYAAVRGVIIIPELESPGHSGQLRSTMPEVFSYRDAAGNPLSLGVTNMVNPKALEVIDTIVGEMAEVFHTSPYIHMGCDEASLGGMENAADVKQYMADNGMTSHNEVFAAYVNKLNAMVKKRGKQMIIWEGPPLGEGLVYDKDIIWMPWVGDAGTASYLVKQGHRVINSPWGTKQPYYDVYDLNGAHLSRDEPLLIGGTGILWERPEEFAVPSTRYAGALRIEPTYNPNSGRDFFDFMRRQKQTDPRLDLLMHGFTIESDDLIDPLKNLRLDPLFSKSATLTVATHLEGGNVHYTTDGSVPTRVSPVLSKPLTIDEKTRVRARWFPSGQGEPAAEFDRTYFKAATVDHAALDAEVVIDPDAPGYYGPGPSGLVDGLLAVGNTYPDAGWVGWLNPGKPVTVTLTLKKPARIESIMAHYLRSDGGVDYPKQVVFATSSDGTTYRDVATIDYAAGADNRGWFMGKPELHTAQFIRISSAHNMEWVFMDEVAVNASDLGHDMTHLALGKPVMVTEPTAPYNLSGIKALTDGYVSSGTNFRSSEWLGFEGKPIEATIDLGSTQTVSRVRGRFLQAIGVGIRIPGAMTVSLSLDGTVFTPAGEARSTPNETSEKVQILVATFAPAKARYIRVLVQPTAQWTFVDEIMVDAK